MSKLDHQDVAQRISPTQIGRREIQKCSANGFWKTAVQPDFGLSNLTTAVKFFCADGGGQYKSISDFERQNQICPRPINAKAEDRNQAAHAASSFDADDSFDI